MSLSPTNYDNTQILISLTHDPLEIQRPQNSQQEKLMKVSESVISSRENEANLESLSSHMGTYVKQETLTFRRIQHGPLKGLPIRTGSVKVENHPRAIQIIDNLAASMKAALLQLTEKELHAAIQHQYQSVRVMKKDGTWKHTGLEKISHKLIPSESETFKTCLAFIDSVAENVKKNPYMLAALDNINDLQIEHYKKKTSKNGIQLAQFLVPYAMALDGLTDAFARDINLFNAVDKIWTKEKKPHNINKYLSLFGWIKYRTLGHLSDLKKVIRKGKVSKNSNRHYLNLNIFEAVVGDLVMGYKNNAKAGEKLIKHPVGGKDNRRTEAGKATIGKPDGYKVLELHPDLPKQWADLYAVWNFTFCSIGETFPTLAAKLLIPSVNDYDSNPEGYIYHRALALYLYFQFSIFRGINHEDHAFISGWHSKEITKAMGQANARSAKQYDNLVKATKKGKVKA